MCPWKTEINHAAAFESYVASAHITVSVITPEIYENDFPQLNLDRSSSGILEREQEGNDSS